MEFINRTGAHVTYWLFNPGDPSRTVSLDHQWIADGTRGTGKASDDADVYVATGQLSGSPPWLTPRFGPYAYNAILIVRHGQISLGEAYEPAEDPSQFRIVDWGTPLAHHVQALPPSTPQKKLARESGARSAMAAVRGFSNFLAFVPVVGNAIKTLADVIVNAIDIVVNNQPKYDPPDKQELVNAIREVVRDELQRQHAEEAASCFLNAVAWIDSQQERYKTVKEMSDHDLHDFTRTVELLLEPSGNFLNYLTHMNTHPEETQHVIPIYLHAVAAYVKLRWYHLITRVSESKKLTAQDLTDDLNHVRKCLDGVNRVKETVNTGLWLTVDQCGLKHDNIPERAMLIDALYQTRTGLPDLSSVTYSASELEKIAQAYTDDIAELNATRPATRVVKANWYILAAPATT